MQALLADAGAHLQAGRPGDAAACLQRAVALEPNAADHHHSLALALGAAGRPDEAAASFERALALAPLKFPGAYKRLGDLRFRQGRAEEAAGCYRRGLVLDPRDPRHAVPLAELHVALAETLRLRGKRDEAAAHCRHALTLQPELSPAYLSLAATHLDAGAPELALAAATQALVRQQSPAGRSLFLRALTSVRFLAQADDALCDMVVRALTEPWIRPSEIVSASLVVVRADRDVAESMARAAATWPRWLSADELFGPDGLAAVCRDHVLVALLESTRTAGVELERFLTQARAALLHDVLAGAGAFAATEGFACALARQCFIVEYVFALDDAQQRAVATLRQRLEAALASGTEISGVALALFAAYAPLGSLARAPRLLERPWPPAVDALLTQQVREPLVEAAMRDGIPRLTPIADDTSARVRAQYEESPYPRWVRIAPVPAAPGIDLFLRARFPRAAFRTLRKTTGLDILVAGCGTGQSSIECAHTFATSGRVLAIDLSLASLCYAKARSRGLVNIDYAQADLLALPSLGRAFDVIHVTGVLHHLADPDAGWRALLDCLRPNGFICVGLYSELARRSVVAARDYIARRGHGDSADDIRRCRQEIMAAGPPLDQVVQLNDFFGLSNCRDLLFHVQEHRFTLPRIKTWLADGGLDLVGFGLPAATLAQYAARFPQDLAMTDLDAWHAFEQEHPDTFAGMYQFWAQKR